MIKCISCIFLILGIVLSQNANSKGMLDFMDPCKDAESDFKSSSTSIRHQTKASVSKIEAWYKSPDSLPSDMKAYYREAVKSYAYKVWSDSPTGKGTIASWRAANANVDIKNQFLQFIYPKEVSTDLENSLATQLFKRDYIENIKPNMDKEVKEINAMLASKKEELDEACSSDVVSQVFRGTLGRVIMIGQANFDAAKNEDGDIAAAVRAITGISITDIFKYGLSGGENSEINKLKRTWIDALDNAGVGKNHFVRETLRSLDVTNMNVPKELQITIDSRSLKNACTNATLGIVKC